MCKVAGIFVQGHMPVMWNLCIPVLLVTLFITVILRTFMERLKDYFRMPSPIDTHANTTEHSPNVEASVLWVENNFTRTTNKVIFIMVNDQSLNRNIGKYHLSHIWDDIIFNTPDLKLRQSPPHLYFTVPLAH